MYDKLGYFYIFGYAHTSFIIFQKIEKAWTEWYHKAQNTVIPYAGSAFIILSVLYLISSSFITKIIPASNYPYVVICFYMIFNRYTGLLFRSLLVYFEYFLTFIFSTSILISTFCLVKISMKIPVLLRADSEEVKFYLEQKTSSGEDKFNIELARLMVFLSRDLAFSYAGIAVISFSLFGILLYFFCNDDTNKSISYYKEPSIYKKLKKLLIAKTYNWYKIWVKVMIVWGVLFGIVNATTIALIGAG